MKTILCSLWAVLFLCLLVCPSVLAQTDSTAEAKPSVNINSNRKYKREIGINIDALYLISGRTSMTGNYALFFRRHKIVTKKSDLVGVNNVKYIAYRFKLGTNLSFKKLKVPDVRDIDPDYGSYFNHNWYNSMEQQNNFFVSFGRERQFRSGRFEIFYGYDFHVARYASRNYSLQLNWYSFQDDNFVVHQYNYNTSHLTKYRNINIGASAIAGFKFFLVPRLCFSGEAVCGVSYQDEKNIQYYQRYNDYNNDYYEYKLPTGQSGIVTWLNPLYVVNMGYYF